MATQELPPRPEFEAGEAETEETVAVPEGTPSDGGQADARAARGRRAMRVAVIVFVALATGQFMQSYGPAGTASVARVAHVAAAAAARPAFDARALQPVAAVVLTPVKPPATPWAGSAAAERASRANIVLASATPDGAAPGGAAAGCGASLAVRAEPDAMLGLALSAPCHGGERVVLEHAGLSLTGRLDVAGRLAMALPALAADGAVSVIFADGERLRGAAAVPGLAALRRVALQWRPGEGFSLHGLEAGARVGTAGDVSDRRPGAPDGAEGWLVRLDGGAVADPMMAEVFTFPAQGAQPMEAAVVARVTADSCGQTLLAQSVVSSLGKAQLTELTVAMPACGGAAGYVVLHDLFDDLRMAGRH